LLGFNTMRGFDDRPEGRNHVKYGEKDEIEGEFGTGHRTSFERRNQ